MSKEAARGDDCACGQRIAFMQYHWPHCRMNPKNLSGATKTHMEARFTKQELATISSHGPVADKPFSKKRKSAKRNKVHGKAVKNR